MKIKKYIVYLFTIVIFSGISLRANAQEADLAKGMLTADSLASGNFKDVLTSFFKLAFVNLTGDNKEFKFTSNMFAIMLRSNPDLKIDTNYSKYSAARNFNIDLDAKLDSTNKFNGFNIGLKYAIINHRDITVDKAFLPEVKRINQTKYKLFNQAAKEIMKHAELSPSQKQKLFNQNNDFLDKSTHKTFNDLDSTLQQIYLTSSSKAGCFDLTSIKDYEKQNLGAIEDNSYDSLKNLFQNKGLLTSFINSTSYTDQFQVKDVNMGLEYVKGIVNPNAGSNVEINVKAEMALSNDSAKIDRNLNRKVINGELGFNWVLKGWNGNQHFLELKLSGSEQYIASGENTDEDKNLFTLNGTIRFRISNDISIPLEFKYDPKNANVFGFLNITSDFTWLGNWIK